MCFSLDFRYRFIDNKEYFMGSPTCLCVSARRQEGLKGKTVKYRRGPAAVTPNFFNHEEVTLLAYLCHCQALRDQLSA